MEASFEDINAQVAKGQLEVNDDLSITDKSFSTFASKGYTSKTFWWGERATYTNSQTKKAVEQLQDAATDINFIAVAIAWIPTLSVPTGVTSAYCGKLAKSMKSKNKGKGVILDMTWALAYKVKSR